MGRSLPFWKVEGIGNDFVLVHLDDVDAVRGEQNAEDFLRDLAIKVCERRFSIGSDGLLAVGMDGDSLVDRMFNPDGTEDFCGNGLRCVARHAYSQSWVGTEFVIRHLQHLVPTRIIGDAISTDIGVASYDPESIPVRFESDPEKTFERDGIWDSFGGSVLTTGSTHTVIYTDAPLSDEVFFRASPEIEHDPQFPERTSVIWTQVVAPMKLRVRIWERGAGETQGCGTGSSAAAIDYMRREGVSGTVEVHNPGGVVLISADSWDSPITISGEAVEVFRGQVPV